MFKLLTVGNPKTIRGEVQGYLTFILHLAPSDTSGYETCANATMGCKLACLNTAGRGGMFRKGESTNVIQEARKRKTRLFFENRTEFMRLLVKDVQRAILYAQRRGLIPVFRLNGTSDIPWEKIRVEGARNIFDLFPTVTFYDYTKIVNRRLDGLSNYSVTFSLADGNDAAAHKAIHNLGLNVAVVFDTKKGKSLPIQYMGLPVVDGDESDLRFLDPHGVIVGLRAKGRAKKDITGFVKTTVPMIPLKLAA